MRACERSLAAGCLEISPGGSPTCPGLQRELTSSNLKLLEWTTRGEGGRGAGGGSIFLERLAGWMDVEGMEGAESGEIVQRMWCGSSLLMLEILFGYQ